MSAGNSPIFKGAFQSPNDEFNGLGRIPMVFDIIGPDGVTSVLPPNLRMVLNSNPETVGFSYAQVIERIQTKGGYVEQHWGEGLRSISLTMVTGGFKRLFSGLSNITGGGQDVGGTRRETINYDKYLDMLALFNNNGQIYGTNGQIVFSGKIKLTFDGGIYLGWFDNFNVSESATKPFQFDLTTSFTVDKEVLRFNTTPVNRAADYVDGRTGSSVAGRRVSSNSVALANEAAADPNILELISLGVS
jgi:hypothetical protein